MKLDLPQAFEPFEEHDVRICAAGPARTDAADVLTVRAGVHCGNPYAENAGGTNTGEIWAVVFRRENWISPNRPSEGMQIEPDAETGGLQYPRLTVQRVRLLGGMYHLECSARERGRM